MSAAGSDEPAAAAAPAAASPAAAPVVPVPAAASPAVAAAAAPGATGLLRYFSSAAGSSGSSSAPAAARPSPGSRGAPPSPLSDATLAFLRHHNVSTAVFTQASENRGRTIISPLRLERLARNLNVYRENASLKLVCDHVGSAWTSFQSYWKEFFARLQTWPDLKIMPLPDLLTKCVERPDQAFTALQRLLTFPEIPVVQLGYSKPRADGALPRGRGVSKATARSILLRCLPLLHALARDTNADSTNTQYLYSCFKMFNPPSARSSRNAAGSGASAASSSAAGAAQADPLGVVDIGRDGINDLTVYIVLAHLLSFTDAVAQLVIDENRRTPGKLTITFTSPMDIRMIVHSDWFKKASLDWNDNFHVSPTRLTWLETCCTTQRTYRLPYRVGADGNRTPVLFLPMLLLDHQFELLPHNSLSSYVWQSPELRGRLHELAAERASAAHLDTTLQQTLQDRPVARRHTIESVNKFLRRPAVRGATLFTLEAFGKMVDSYRRDVYNCLILLPSRLALNEFNRVLQRQPDARFPAVLRSEVRQRMLTSAVLHQLDRLVTTDSVFGDEEEVSSSPPALSDRRSPAPMTLVPAADMPATAAAPPPKLLAPIFACAKPSPPSTVLPAVSSAPVASAAAAAAGAPASAVAPAAVVADVREPLDEVAFELAVEQVFTRGHVDTDSPLNAVRFTYLGGGRELCCLATYYGEPLERLSQLKNLIDVDPNSCFTFVVSAVAPRPDVDLRERAAFFVPHVAGVVDPSPTKLAAGSVHLAAHGLKLGHPDLPVRHLDDFIGEFNEAANSNPFATHLASPLAHKFNTAVLLSPHADASHDALVGASRASSWADRVSEKLAPCSATMLLLQQLLQIPRDDGLPQSSWHALASEVWNDQRDGADEDPALFCADSTGRVHALISMLRLQHFAVMACALPAAPSDSTQPQSAPAAAAADDAAHAAADVDMADASAAAATSPAAPTGSAAAHPSTSIEDGLLAWHDGKAAAFEFASHALLHALASVPRLRDLDNGAAPVVDAAAHSTQCVSAGRGPSSTTLRICSFNVRQLGEDASEPRPLAAMLKLFPWSDGACILIAQELHQRLDELPRDLAEELRRFIDDPSVHVRHWTTVEPTGLSVKKRCDYTAALCNDRLDLLPRSSSYLRSILRKQDNLASPHNYVPCCVTFRTAGQPQLRVGVISVHLTPTSSVAARELRKLSMEAIGRWINESARCVDVALTAYVVAGDFNLNGAGELAEVLQSLSEQAGVSYASANAHCENTSVGVEGVHSYDHILYPPSLLHLKPDSFEVHRLDLVFSDDYARMSVKKFTTAYSDHHPISCVFDLTPLVTKKHTAAPASTKKRAEKRKARGPPSTP